MASLRTLFLGVHASNWLIRVLFLPLWYAALLSPFTLAVAWYFGLGRALHRFLPDEFSWFDLLPQLAIFSVFLLLPTRLLSAAGALSMSKDGKRRVQSLPYWIPWVRNLASLVFGGEPWLRSVRYAVRGPHVGYDTNSRVETHPLPVSLRTEPPEANTI